MKSKKENEGRRKRKTKMLLVENMKSTIEAHTDDRFIPLEMILPGFLGDNFISSTFRRKEKAIQRLNFFFSIETKEKKAYIPLLSTVGT